MGKKTSAGYADTSFNFLRGCSKQTAGCDNCHAAVTAEKAGDVLGKWGPDKGGGTRVVAAASSWDEPLKWDAQAKANGVPMRVVAMTLGDVFEPWAGKVLDHVGYQVFLTATGTWTTKQHNSPPRGVEWEPLTKDHVLERWLALVNRTPHLRWLVPTKFPEFVLPALGRVAALPTALANVGSAVAGRWKDGFAPPTVWLGVSAEDAATLSRRVFYLRQVEARVRFLLAEPLLGPMDIRPWFNHARLESDSFNWLVIGGEHGPGARKFLTDWAEDLVAQAREVGLPVWVQSVGANPMTPVGPTSLATLAVSDPKGESPVEWPEGLRVRELPGLEVP